MQEAFRIASDLGVEGVEVRRNPVGRTLPWKVYLDEVTRAWELSPLAAVSFGTPGVNLSHLNPGDCDRALEEGLKFYQAAADRLPISWINLQTGPVMNSDSSVRGDAYHLHGSSIVTDEVMQRIRGGLRILGDVAVERGFRFALETHPCYVHDTAQATKELLDAVDHPAVGALWDYSNEWLFPEDPDMEASLALLRPRLFATHLKNFAVPPKNGSFVVSGLADGIIDTRRQLRLLKESHYTGPLCLESPRSGDREWFAKSDLAYLLELLDPVQRASNC